MEITRDAFLGGKTHALQPASGYRSGVDAVLLAASVPAKGSARILELGCGVGVASLCLSARVTGVQIMGVEIQPDYADLAVQNGLNVVNADLRSLPANLRNSQFDHVMMNPPYFDRTNGSSASDAGRDIAMGGDTPLGDWVTIGTKRLAPKGYITLIQRIERLPEVLSALAEPLGSVTVLPVTARRARPPHLFILQARHSGRAPFLMLPPLVLHDNDAHDGDRDSYTAQVNGILRNGDALPLSR